MAGTFEIFSDKGGDFRFRLKAGNGETILSSQGYKSKDAAMKGVHSVQANASDTSLFEANETEGGKFRFNMKAKNHQVIGTSQNYATSAACENGIGAVGRAADGAKVVDLTDEG